MACFDKFRLKPKSERCRVYGYMSVWLRRQSQTKVKHPVSCGLEEMLGVRVKRCEVSNFWKRARDGKVKGLGTVSLGRGREVITSIIV